ncbi:MAG: nucleotidyltransferase domain-containing protein [Enterococcus sp.]|nr:nucleotidyltransferase domain-containing protein [Enterococcus sp.]
MDSTLLLTIHGSHLYGLNHADSDMDFYRVVSTVPQLNRFGATRKRNGEQVVKDGLDNTVFDFKTFLIHAHHGVPQALEAMFSTVAEVDEISAYRQSYHASVSAMIISYTAAIQKFAAWDFKRRRHALRYALNLRQAIENQGRFDPRLSKNNAEMITEMASSPHYVEHLRKLSYVELVLDESKISELIAADTE